jgi:hypothetical protein
MTCPENPPPPPGYRIMRSTVPPPLTQWAVDLLHQVTHYAFGQSFSLSYAGKSYIARVDHHLTWSYRNGQLVTGLCIPGITIYEPAAIGDTSSARFDTLDTPDPNAAVYSSDYPATTDWKLVAVTAGVTVGLVAAFFLALKHAGKR